MMAAQPDATPGSERQHSTYWGVRAIWALAALFAYFLSFGPVVRFWDSTPFNSPNPVVYTFYLPVQQVYYHTPLHKPFGIYLHLWDPAMYDKNGDERMVLSKPD